MLHVPRHGRGHARLSNQVTPRSTVAALARLGASALVSTTVCGAVDPSLELGSLVVFDDLHFPSNRLADGSLCTLFTSPEIEGRGHWIYDRPFGARRAGRARGRRPRRRASRCATAASTATWTARGSTRSARSPSSPRPA